MEGRVIVIALRPDKRQSLLGLGRFWLGGIENRFFFAIFGHKTGNRFLSQIESQWTKNRFYGENRFPLKNRFSYKNRFFSLCLASYTTPAYIWESAPCIYYQNDTFTFDKIWTRHHLMLLHLFFSYFIIYKNRFLYGNRFSVKNRFPRKNWFFCGNRFSIKNRFWSRDSFPDFHKFIKESIPYFLGIDSALAWRATVSMIDFIKSNNKFRGWALRIKWINDITQQQHSSNFTILRNWKRIQS